MAGTIFSNYFPGGKSTSEWCWSLVTWEVSHMDAAPEKTTMDFYNMSDFLRGQSSKIITKLFEEDEAAFVLKNGRPLAVLMSIERYERLMNAGIDITNY